MSFEPRYMKLYRSGELAERAGVARARLSACDLCARKCGIDRLLSPEKAPCHTGSHARVSSYGAHFGEEDPLRGERGSGTVFFAWCSLRCIYCQNSDVSWDGHGQDVSAEGLAAMMVSLQSQGCHNINFVSPSHVVAQILESLVIAIEKGLRIPLVYNTGGYDALDALELLDGVIDVYMPDVKYADGDTAKQFSGVADYVDVNRAATKAMHAQVGDLVLDEDGIAQSGLIVRHLVMPNDVSGTNDVLRFIAEELSTNTYVNVMEQYRPCHRAADFPELARRPSEEEFLAAFREAKALGLERLDPRTTWRKFVEED